MVANSLNEDKHEETSVDKNNQTAKQTRKRKKKLRIRKFPILLRIIVIMLLAIGCLILGLMVGYGIIGDGDMMDVLDKQTWQHIVDIVMKEK